MSKKRMHGFLDPITLGFVLSIVGSVSVLTLEKTGPSDQTVKVDSVEMSQQLPESEASHDLPGS